jgi:hypothetical protein
MKRGVLRIFGIGAWATVLCLYPAVGLFLIFAKMPFKTDMGIAQGLGDIETALNTVLDIELEA